MLISSKRTWKKVKPKMKKNRELVILMGHNLSWLKHRLCSVCFYAQLVAANGWYERRGSVRDKRIDTDLVEDGDTVEIEQSHSPHRLHTISSPLLLCMWL